MRDVESVPIEAVAVGSNRRALCAKTVSALVESIEALGLLQPITVRFVSDEEPMHLVAGHHRLAAARELGWQFIPAFVFEDINDIDAAISEIDENLIRAELSPAERAEQTAERKRLWEQKSGANRTALTGRGNRGFASETARATGRDKSAVTRDVQRGEAIAPEVMAEIKADPDLNKGVVLDMVARSPRHEQRQRLTEIAAERAQVVSADDKQLEALQSAWNRASSEARDRFLAWMETPVMDRRWKP